MMRILPCVACLTILAGAAAAATETRAPAAAEAAEFMRKNYPPGALKRGEQGKVGFRLTVDPNGSLVGCDITASSGFETLDRETCDFLARYAKVEPAADASGRKVRTTKTGYVDWRLPSHAVALAAPTAAGSASAAKPEELVCKSSPAPGSIIKKIRRCMTRTEWKQQDQRNLDVLDRTIGNVYCGDHGC